MNTVIKTIDKEILIDVTRPIRGYAIVDDKTYKNVLTRNMLSYILGLLTDTKTKIVTTGGSDYTVDTVGDANRDPCRMRWGTGTTPPSILDYKLASETGNAVSYPVLVRAGAKYLIQWQGVFSTSVREIGISQLINGFYDGASGSFNILLSRALVSVEPNQILYYNIEVNRPFNRNFATLLCYYLRDENSSMVRDDGVSFTANTSGDVNNGSASIFVSSDTHSGDVDDLVLQNYTTIPTTHGFSVGDTGATYTVSGTFRPTAGFTIRTVGIVQMIFSATGASNPVILATLPLPSPVYVNPGETRNIVFRFYVTP